MNETGLGISALKSKGGVLGWQRLSFGSLAMIFATFAICGCAGDASPQLDSQEEGVLDSPKEANISSYSTGPTQPLAGCRDPLIIFSYFENPCQGDHCSDALSDMTSKDKAVTLYNKGDTRVNLDGYELRIHRAGKETTTVSFRFKDEAPNLGLDAGHHLIIYRSDGSEVFKRAVTSPIANVSTLQDPSTQITKYFTGDDQLQLYSSDARVDVLGNHAGTETPEYNGGWGKNMIVVRRCEYDTCDATNPTLVDREGAGPGYVRVTGHTAGTTEDDWSMISEANIARVLTTCAGCSKVAGPTCTAEAEDCVYDAKCLEPAGGPSGCSAGGVAGCRSCGFGGFPACPVDSPRRTQL